MAINSEESYGIMTIIQNEKMIELDELITISDKLVMEEVI